MARSSTGTRVQRALLALLPSLEVTHESWAAHLAAAWRRGVDRSLVSHWRAGSRPMPVDAVPELIRHASAESGDPEEEVAELVLGVLAREVGCVVLRLPAAGAGGAEVTTRLLALGGMLGALQAQLAADMADGQYDPHERARMADGVRALIRDASKLMHALEDGVRR